MAGVYLVKGDDELVPMSEEPYITEDVLQSLLAKHPDLLAGDQIDSAAPRRWLLISREVPLPGEEDGAWRWTVDHLFLDQDAVPTLVEVKRSTDTRMRREVVGQMLDYAANAVAYWPVATIRASFEARCAASGLAPDQELGALLGDDEDVEEFLTEGITHTWLLAARTVCGYPGIIVSACLRGSGPQARVMKSPCISKPPHGTKALVPGVSVMGRPLA